jgi:hypothetical protein
VSVDEVARRPRNAPGLCPKELCPALSVSGRAAPDVLGHDLLTALPLCEVSR